jgi:predicted dehydrogenase
LNSVTPKLDIEPQRVVLVGGGRWGRVYAGVLQKLLPIHSEILWVSRHNRSELLADTQEYHGEAIITVLDSVELALNRKPNAAVVVTAAHTHAAITRILLQNGIHVFVEKPFTLNIADAEDLIDLAESKGLALGVGLHLLFASYLRHFRSHWSNRQVSNAQLRWFDCETETRYGTVKRTDVTTSKVHDIFPHLWALLRVFFPKHAVRVVDVKSLERGDGELILSVNDVTVSAHISRRAPARSRCIELEFKDGGTARLDFTMEPGNVSIDGQEFASDPDWGRIATPLAAEVSSFLAVVKDPSRAPDWQCLARNVVGSVIGAEIAANRLTECDARKLAQLLASNVDTPTLYELLIDNLAPELNLLGIRITTESKQQSLVRAGLFYLNNLDGNESSDIPEKLRQALLHSNFLKRVAAA